MSTVAWFQDSDWSVLEVLGKDRTDFLHRLTTNALPQPGMPLTHNFFLSVNARIQAEFWVAAQEERLVLFTPTVQLDPLKECIDRYHFGEQIEVQRPELNLFVVSGLDAATLREHCQFHFSPDPRYGADCHWCAVQPEHQDQFLDYLRSVGQEMSSESAERRRITLGRPKAGLDYDEETLFVEVAQRDDFSETKGCYPGQEIVARVLHRGRLNRHLRGFTSSLVVPMDWLLKVDGKEVASVRSVVSDGNGGSMGYLMVRREYGEVGQSLTALVGGEEYSLTVVERAGEVLTGEDS